MSDEATRESEIQWQAWSNQRHIQRGEYNAWDAFMAGWLAGSRRALEDATERADEIEGAPLYIDGDNTVIWIHTRPQIDQWLAALLADPGDGHTHAHTDSDEEPA